jgi:hypothetical protein
MNPYKVNYKKFKDSKKISNPKDLLKLRLTAGLLNIISEMENTEVMSVTGLHKSDLSRLRCLNIERFTIDRIIEILNSLGFSAKLTIEPSKKAS